LALEAGDPPLAFFERVEAPLELAADHETVVRQDPPAGGRVRLLVKADAFFMAGLRAALVRAEDGREIPLKEFAGRLGAPWGMLEAHAPAIARPLLRPGLYRARVELPGHEPFETTIRIDVAAVTDVVAEMVRLRD
jgi:hypothetical protein